MAQIKVSVNELGIFSGCYETVWINSGKDIDLVMEGSRPLLSRSGCIS